MTIPLVHFAPLAGCLAAAAYFDVTTRKIPNAITAAVAATGLGVQLWDNGPVATLAALGAAVMTIAVLYRPWSAGGVGGGDVKLAAAVAIWVGLDKMIGYVLATAVAGGLVAAVCYLLSKSGARREIRENLVSSALTQTLPPATWVSATRPAVSGSGATTTAGRMTVPYGLAVIIGGVVALWGSTGL